MNKEKATLQNINTEKNNNPFEEIVMIVENTKERAYRKSPKLQYQFVHFLSFLPKYQNLT